MAQELKHVGRVIATNKKCLVAYRTLPGDAHYCLIVPTENMPDIYHDAIINLVETGAAQDSYEFAEVLDRTQFPDGSRMLPWLHVNNRLIKAPTSAIDMTPRPGVGIQLSELNQIIAEQRGIAVDDLSLKAGIGETTTESLTTKAEAKIEATPTATSTVILTPEAQAKEYRSQADKLAKQAAEMRRKAEELVPTKKTVK